MACPQNENYAYLNNDEYTLFHIPSVLTKDLGVQKIYKKYPPNFVLVQAFYTMKQNSGHIASC